MKAALFGLFGFVAFSLVWVWYYLKPAFNKATGVAAYKAVLLYNPLFWAIGMTAAFGCASLYLWWSLGS
ncbi:MAG TPA: hypothetical protein VK208_13240 [Pyrinomonadaceae bacterium]|nr:hypothetical protein [Pyrinomonadaceae bacterium]